MSALFVERQEATFCKYRMNKVKFEMNIVNLAKNEAISTEMTEANLVDNMKE